MRALDVFSGIGGCALGLELAGIEVVGFVEFDDGRRDLLQTHFPGVPVAKDIRDYHAQRYQAEIIIGGPPCKATSIAAAVHGYRSGDSLWSHMLRVGLELEANWFVVEQPPGNTAWEASVARGLARHGYYSARSEFGACDVGAIHIRRRVFILAHRSLPRLAMAWRSIPSQIDQFKRATLDRNSWVCAPPRTLRMAHGLPDWLDRKAAIRAIGDSIPPAMIAVIGYAITGSE